MANHISHAALPYPVKGCRFTILVPYLDADGDPTDPTTPDTERSIDAAAFADCTEEASTISGSNGMAYLTLTGDEMNGSAVAVAAKVASGPKATLATLYPRVLPIVASGTATAGAAGTITLAVGSSAIDDYYTGMIIRTTGGTGGAGGSGSLGNQARMITNYVGSTRVATVIPNWETNPSSDTTYEVLNTEFAMFKQPDAAAIATVVAAPSAATIAAAVAAPSAATISSTLLGTAIAQVFPDWDQTSMTLHELLFTILVRLTKQAIVGNIMIASELGGPDEVLRWQLDNSVSPTAIEPVAP